MQTWTGSPLVVEFFDMNQLKIKDTVVLLLIKLKSKKAVEFSIGRFADSELEWDCDQIEFALEFLAKLPIHLFRKSDGQEKASLG